MLIFGAANLYTGLYCFRYLMFKYPNTKIYSELVKKILGHQGENIINWIFIIYVWGSLIAYIMVG